MEKQLLENQSIITTLNTQIKEKNKTITNLRDVIEHRESQLGLNKKRYSK